MIAKGSTIKIIIESSKNDKAGGPGHGRNACVALAAGSLICHLDADDIMAPNRISSQVKICESEGAFCLVG